MCLFRRAVIAKTWPTTDGLILQSEFTEKVGLEPSYEAKILYRYSVRNQTFASTGVRTRKTSSKSESDIRSTVARYPVGSKPKVHFNPSNPSESYLEVGVDYVNYIIIFSPIFFAFLFGTGMREQIQNFREMPSGQE
jgi:hypothetical protein